MSSVCKASLWVNSFWACPALRNGKASRGVAVIEFNSSGKGGAELNRRRNREVTDLPNLDCRIAGTKHRQVVRGNRQAWLVGNDLDRASRSANVDLILLAHLAKWRIDPVDPCDALAAPANPAQHKIAVDREPCLKA